MYTRDGTFIEEPEENIFTDDVHRYAQNHASSDGSFPQNLLKPPRNMVQSWRKRTEQKIILKRK